MSSGVSRAAVRGVARGYVGPLAGFGVLPAVQAAGDFEQAVDKDKTAGLNRPADGGFVDAETTGEGGWGFSTLHFFIR